MKLDLSRFHKSRETHVEAGGHVFIIRRPTALDVARLQASGGALTIEHAVRFIAGWDKVTELDLIPGGVPEPLDFDNDLCAAWVSDRPDLWEPIIKGVVDAYRRHEEAQETRGNV